jgi:hypothetical protein
MQEWIIFLAGKNFVVKHSLLLVYGAFNILIQPSVKVEWIARLLLIREVPGSNLCPKTRYLD